MSVKKAGAEHSSPLDWKRKESNQVIQHTITSHFSIRLFSSPHSKHKTTTKKKN